MLLDNGKLIYLKKAGEGFGNIDQDRVAYIEAYLLVDGSYPLVYVPANTRYRHETTKHVSDFDHGSIRDTNSSCILVTRETMDGYFKNIKKNGEYLYYELNSSSRNLFVMLHAESRVENL